MVFLLKVVKTIQTIIDSIKFSRVEINAFQLTTDVLSKVFQLDIGAIDALYIFSSRGQHTFNAPQGRERATQRLYDACTFCRESIVSGIERTLDVFGVSHRVTLLLKFFLFTLLKVGPHKFVALELQEVKILAITLNIVAEGLKLLKGNMVFVINILIQGQLFGIVGDDINHVHLEVLLVKQKVLMLRVYINKSLTEFLKHRELYRCIVDKGATLTG